MMVRRRFRLGPAAVGVCLTLLSSEPGTAQPPVLSAVFPAGARSGESVDVTVSGSRLDGLQTLHTSIPGFRCVAIGSERFRVTVPDETLPGLYDLWGVGSGGISAPRTFAVSQRAEQVEAEPNDEAATAAVVPLGVVINGQLDKGGDADHFRFEARQGQRVLIECWAERIDSRLRAVLEVFDAAGRRLAVNRGYFGIDPLIDLRVPADGSFVVRVQDLVSSGSAEHFYRLEIDAGARVVFSQPCVVPRGRPTRVTLYGWNLSQAGGITAAPGNGGFDSIEVEIAAEEAAGKWPLPLRLRPAQVILAGESFAYRVPGGRAPVLIGTTDVPVMLERDNNHAPTSAQEIVVPCEVSGQLAAGDECDWFSFAAARGEVLYIEGFGERIGAPVDLQIAVWDVQARSELARFGDEVRGGGSGFRTDHLDPSGRWVSPADGEYLLAVRNLTGGLDADPRRQYRLSVRREEPAFDVVAVHAGDEPSGLTVRRGERVALVLRAIGARGLAGPIRVFARDLPPGLECPDVWLGPGVDEGVLVVSAAENAPQGLGELRLAAEAEGVSGIRTVRGGTVVRSGRPTGWGRITSQIPLVVAGDAPLRLTADAHELLDHHLYGGLPVRHSPGGVVDVAVQVERRDTGHQAPVRLIGRGLPESIENQASVIPAGETKGYLSFYLPPTLPVGRYSLAVEAETTVPGGDQQAATVRVTSNVVTVDVQPAAFLVEVDPFTVTRVRRGEVFQVAYSARRRNGFIGKMHTELAAPGRITHVEGLRGRGETFVGQTDRGSLQITVNDDAPLGEQRFLRLLTVGVLEDQPVFQGACWLPLEIVE